MSHFPREKAHSVGLLAIRSMLGVVFLFHGSQKLFGAFGGPGLTGFAGYLDTLDVPLPMVSAVLAATAEFVGGLALLLGLGTRLATVPVVITMLVAALKVHSAAFSVQAGGLEYPLSLAVITAGIGLTGAGEFSLDQVLANAWNKSAMIQKIAPRRATVKA